MTRVTHGYEGGPSEQPHAPKRPGEEDAYGSLLSAGAGSPAFSADGTLIAFSSSASNLVFGDGNTPPAGPLDGSDAFLVERQAFSSLPTPRYVSPAPETLTQPSWQLGVTALSRSSGSVALYVEVPGVGTLRAGAQSAVAIRSVTAARVGRRGRRASSRGRVSRTVATRTVATSATGAGDAGLTTLMLALVPRYAALAGEHGGLSATVTVTFTAPGHPTLRESISATFLRKLKPSRSKDRSSKAGRRSSKAGRRS